VIIEPEHPAPRFTPSRVMSAVTDQPGRPEAVTPPAAPVIPVLRPA